MSEKEGSRCAVQRREAPNSKSQYRNPKQFPNIQIHKLEARAACEAGGWMGWIWMDIEALKP
jgi:hypothetical protein